MRGEARRVGDRQVCPPESPLDRASDVAVARESHPAALGVPDRQPLNGWRRRLVPMGAAVDGP